MIGVRSEKEQGRTKGPEKGQTGRTGNSKTVGRDEGIKRSFKNPLRKTGGFVEIISGRGKRGKGRREGVGWDERAEDAG